MHILYEQIAIDNCWTVVVGLRDKQEITCHALVYNRRCWKKNFKKQHISAYNGLP